MSSDFNFHPVFEGFRCNEGVVRVLSSFVKEFEIDALHLSVPEQLFSRAAFRHPRRYRVAVEMGLEIDPYAIAGVDTALIGKIAGQSQGEVDITPTKMAAYIAHWTDEFLISFAISDKKSHKFIANLFLTANIKKYSDVDIESYLPADLAITGPRIADPETDLLSFIDWIEHIVRLDGFAYGMISREGYPILREASALLIRDEAPETMRARAQDMAVVDEIATRDGIVKVFIRPDPKQS